MITKQKKYISLLLIMISCLILTAFCIPSHQADISGQMSDAGSPAMLKEKTKNGTAFYDEFHKDTKIREAMNLYENFLAKKNLYKLTSTAEYPRGDSTAVYAFSDCTGDGVPEMHLKGGYDYRIYTCREGKVVLFKKFIDDLCKNSPLIPLKNGYFLRYTAAGITNDGLNYRKPEWQTSIRKPGERESYSYFALTGDGAIEYLKSFYSYGQRTKSNGFKIVYNIGDKNCTKEEWETAVEPYRKMIDDKKLHLDSWNYVFPQKEWDYLNAMEEGNGDFQYKDDSPEWAAYKRILSGDFSLIEDPEERSYLTSSFTYSLDKNTGRSSWSYMLLDMNGDGLNELYYQDKDQSRGLGSFIYKDGSMTWWYKSDAHESETLLKDGRSLCNFAYGSTSSFITGRYDLEFNFIPDKVYTELTISWEEGSYYDKQYYKKFLEEWHWELYTFGERIYKYPDIPLKQGTYYFTQDFKNKVAEGVMTQLSKKEWKEINNALINLYIPDSNWKPVSVFMPNRRQEHFSYG